MKRIALAAVAVIVALASTWTATAAQVNSSSKPAQFAPTSARCTAQAFRPFAKKVWNPELWQRGKPDRHSKAIKAQRRRLACAPAGHRKAMQRAWHRAQDRFFHHRGFCLSGPVFAGRVSVFSGGLTAGGYQATEPGIALYQTSTLGSMYRVRTGGNAAYLRHIDYGPAPWTGRVIDITIAGANVLGGVTTDAWGEAKLIPSGCI